MKPKTEGAPSQLINEKIKFDKMQVISYDGKNLGVILRDEALRIARQADLDLVLLAEQGADGFPVTKIMDFGKALYAKKKQQNEAKKSQKIIQVKEIKMRPKIAEHDYTTKVNQAIEFLKDGKHVKFTLMFKGREAVMREERGSEIFKKIDTSFEEAALTRIVAEKDSKTPQLWSRVYFLKNK
ncbi:translation initiation factor IF-3 [Candidatus Dependentiae bacterium]|nr:translation initiation factor IF-3 [Candidatus Dependentiae bacterium]